MPLRTWLILGTVGALTILFPVALININVTWPGYYG